MYRMYVHGIKIFTTVEVKRLVFVVYRSDGIVTAATRIIAYSIFNVLYSKELAA